MDIKYIKDNEGTNFFPVAHEKGIIDNNGTTLESKIGTLNDAMSSKADKATTYTKAEVNNLIPSVDNDTQIVSTLPASGVANTIYRVPGTNSYTDYAWDGTQFVALGTFTGNVNDGYTYMGVATTSTTPDTSDPNVYYIAGEAGTYTNFNNLLHTGGIGIFKWDGSTWSYDNAAIVTDATPAEGSSNPIQSGAVAELEMRLGASFDITQQIELQQGYLDKNGKLTAYSTWYWGLVYLKKNKRITIENTSIGSYPSLGLTDNPNFTIGDTATIVSGKTYLATADTYVVISAGTGLVSAAISSDERYIETDATPIENSINPIQSGGVHKLAWNYEDKVFDLLKLSFEGVENLADFSSYSSSDVTYNKIGADGYYTVSFDGNVITATQSTRAGGSFSIDMSTLGLTTGQKYLIAIKRVNEVSHGQTIDVAKFVTSSSLGTRVGRFTIGDYYQYFEFTAEPNRYLQFSQYYSETTINYNIYIYRVTDVVESWSLAHSNNNELAYHSMLFEEELNHGENPADFSAYTGADIIYNTNSNIVEFSGNKIFSALGANGNSYVCISLDGLSLSAGKEYKMRIVAPDYSSADGWSINKSVTSSSTGVTVASFVATDKYFSTSLIYESGLALKYYQSHNNENISFSVYICEVQQHQDGVTETKTIENFANRMSWTALPLINSGTANYTATKVDNGVTIYSESTGNVAVRFLLPQLKEGHTYNFTISGDITGAVRIQDYTGGSYRYTFSDNALTIENYKEVYYPLCILFNAKYGNTTRNIQLYITDANEPEQKAVIKNEALVNIDQQNISNALLERCDYLQDNPTLYRGLDIVAFNKGICIGDSLTAGSINTTDSQGSVGPNVPADPTKAYPAKLARLTGIDITNAGDGGKTFLGYYNAHQNDDWSGNEFAIIELGRNDVAQPPVGYGQWNPTDQSDSFYPMGKSEYGFRCIVSKLKAENKNIKIFVCDNTNIVGNKENGGLAEGVAQIVSNLNDPDVILLEMHKYGKLNTTNAYQCGHLSQYGYYRLAQDYCNYISWYMATHKEEFRFIQFIGTDYVYTKDF